MLIDIYARDNVLFDNIQEMFRPVSGQKTVSGGAIVTYLGLELQESTVGMDIIHLSVLFNAANNNVSLYHMISELTNWLYDMLIGTNVKHLRIDRQRTRLNQQEIIQAIGSALTGSEFFE